MIYYKFSILLTKLIISNNSKLVISNNNKINNILN